MFDGSAESDRVRFRCRSSRRTLSLDRPRYRPAGMSHGIEQLKEYPARVFDVFKITAENDARRCGVDLSCMYYGSVALISHR